MKKRWKLGWRGWLADFLIIGGGAAIAAGVWCIYQPAGLIVGGALALGGAWLAARGGGENG